MSFAAKTDWWYLALFYGFGLLMLLVPFLPHKKPKSVNVTMILLGLVFIGIAFVNQRSGFVITADGYLEGYGWPFEARYTHVDQIASVEPSSDLTASRAASADRLRIDYGEGKFVFIAVHDKEGFMNALVEKSTTLERTTTGVRRR